MTPDLYSFENLWHQYRRCRRNKRNTLNQLRFEIDAEANLLALQRELREHTYRPGRSICFVTDGPKPREVFAADFRDRVVHQCWSRNRSRSSSRASSTTRTLAAPARACWRRAIACCSSCGRRRPMAAGRRGGSSVVSIELPGSVEEQLRTLAARQGRDVRALVEDAIRQYLEAAAITDVDPNDVAAAQAALLHELPRIPDWKAGDA